MRRGRFLSSSGRGALAIILASAAAALAAHFLF